MIVRGYTVDLYCDGDGPHGYREDTASFGGETYQDCAKQARAQGWRLSHDRTRALCPKCNPKWKQQPAAPPASMGEPFDVMAAYTSSFNSPEPEV